ncbi:uncharacterized protein BO72DRAFT_458522 [Aspergillus fijiensis CBS 313.89]|uniref:Uncharacterized protein n=1 Tax=Aspergillus fijiensis CBS 313.89 TaxID=1448319 RepID=A0A8G1W229_9EURO|nr:uncharacterized protein BO72DRAFT_458522 [Aspergillus fijiensis CBS 313.89]RAK77614.1 hypothetical protein BO72DRAFT_458522 [Aspergillus fijiensis CBS 313.89]
MGPEESYPPPYQNPQDHPSSTITIPPPAYITIDPSSSEEVHKLDHFPPKSDDIGASFTNPAKSTATATISEPERLHQPPAALPKPSLSFKPITIPTTALRGKRKRNPPNSNPYPYTGTLTRKRELLPLP